MEVNDSSENAQPEKHGKIIYLNTCAMRLNVSTNNCPYCLKRSPATNTTPAKTKPSWFYLTGTTVWSQTTYGTSIIRTSAGNGWGIW